MTDKEIDTLVAEKVMGGVQKFCNGVEMSLKPDGSGDVKYIYEDFIPDYSTSIAAAWEVVDALWERGFGLEIENFECVQAEFDEYMKNPDKPPVWWVDVSPKDNRYCEVREINDSLPMAICLAALKAVGAIAK